MHAEIFFTLFLENVSSENVQISVYCRWTFCCQFSSFSSCCFLFSYHCSTKHPSALLPWQSLPLVCPSISLSDGTTNLSFSASSSVSEIVVFNEW